MLNNNYNIWQIKRYIQHKMSDKERYAFERSMEADPFLKDAVEGYEKVDLNNIESILTKIKTRTLSHNSSKTIYMWVRIAASIIIIVGISTLFYITNNHTQRKQLSVNQTTKELIEPKNADLHPMKPYEADLPDSDILVPILKESTINKKQSEFYETKEQPKLSANSIKKQTTVNTNISNAPINLSPSSTTGEIKGELISAEQNIGRSKKMIIKNGREVPADEYFEVKTKEVDINGYDIYGNQVASNYKAEANNNTYNSYNDELTDSPELNKKYFTSSSNSDSAFNWLDISKIATRDSSLFYTATIGDEKFIKRIERKLKFPFDSINQTKIKIEVTILIAATGETTGIIVKEELPENFVTDLEKTIKESTKWFVPINNYKPLSGSRTIVFIFKK